jgi:hypothetical protein
MDSPSGGPLTEIHQFVLALVAQVSSFISMIFLYRSTPKKDADANAALPKKSDYSSS